MSRAPQLRISGERLWSRLMDMARIGATPRGGCNRLALTDEDRAARELFMSWCREVGCEVRVDEIGNIFARRSGRNSDRPPVLAGSHLDTQPTGGRFDGVFGVLAALEVVETLNDHGLETGAPIDVVSWTNEEGARFAGAMTGSAVWSGQMSLEEARALRDADGKSFGEELQRIGFVGDLPARPAPLTACFEIHIEQGPRLEAEGTTIGVVTGAQHMGWYEIRIRGREAHAGTTPMAMRHDPMRGLSRILPRLFAIADQHGEDSRLTCGVVHTEPASINTVPGLLTMTLDIRHPDRSAHETMVRDCSQIVQEECSGLGLAATLESLWETPGVVFDRGCIDAVRKAASLCGCSFKEMLSGAGHDAVNVSKVAPTSMIFVPCEGGVSHNEEERAEPADLEAGCNVLLHAVLAMAG
jgi:N-carbamoyl-L-amino-acid hydrolase